MKMLVVIAILVCLSAIGGWFGYSIGRPQAQEFPVIGSMRKTSTVIHQAPTQVVKPMDSFTDLMEQLREADSPEMKYPLLRQLDLIPTSEVRERFLGLAQSDSDEQVHQNKELWEALDFLVVRDPQAAVRLCRECFTGDNLSYAFAQIVNTWSSTDPEGALRFIASLEETNEDIYALNSTVKFLSVWADADPKGALAAWLALPEPKIANPEVAADGAERLAASAARTPELREAALDRLMAAPPSDERSAALAGVLGTWARCASLREASDWINSQDLNGKERNRIAVAAATAAARKDGVEAGNWLVETLVGEEHDRVQRVNEFTENWARRHPNDCAEWLTTLQPSTENDGAIRGFLYQVSQSDPESGFHWTRRIHDLRLREKLAKQLWSKWRRQAPVAAEAFVPSLDREERQWLGQGQ